MTSAEFEQLRIHVTEFYCALLTAIECESSFSEHHRFRSFPRDCCDWASEILVLYLNEKSYRNMRLVTGCRTTGSIDTPRHTWVEVDGIIVDVTAWQFKDMKGKEITVSNESKWHGEWDILPRDCAKIDAETVSRLNDAPQGDLYAILRGYCETPSVS